ncbi:hypothetical protein BGZ60DRAFT_133992 [Tricladium varicosporioides]|nr:hypothetical protein BGZ60DRAFT_133992 [Hymenoscyphus varicosporioides]
MHMMGSISCIQMQLSPAMFAGLLLTPSQYAFQQCWHHFEAYICPGATNIKSTTNSRMDTRKASTRTRNCSEDRKKSTKSHDIRKLDSLGILRPSSKALGLPLWKPSRRGQYVTTRRMQTPFRRVFQKEIRI